MDQDRSGQSSKQQQKQPQIVFEIKTRLTTLSRPCTFIHQHEFLAFLFYCHNVEQRSTVYLNNWSL